MKLGKQPILCLGVTRSDQNAEYATCDHLPCSPSAVLNSACRTSKCDCSTMPLARELYPLILICLMWYFFSMYPSATTKGLPLSEMNDLHEHAPSADDVLEDPVTERLRCLLAEHAKFWIVSK